jgi:hypothetical protein
LDLHTIGTDHSVDGVLNYGLDPDVVRLFHVVTAEAYRFPELSRMLEEQTAHGIACAVGQMPKEEVRLGPCCGMMSGPATKPLLGLIIGAPTKEAGRGRTKLTEAEPASGSRGQ